MSPSAPINPQSFVCGDCGRSYRTKDSLTRHRHNHDESNLHVCSTCSLTFNRSDVLSRHVRIHHRGRKRSPRACTSCKIAKIKCDAGTPCARCAAASQTCKYEIDSSTERQREQLAARQRGARQRTSSGIDTSTSTSRSTSTSTTTAATTTTTTTTTIAPTTTVAPTLAPAHSIATSYSVGSRHCRFSKSVGRGEGAGEGEREAEVGEARNLNGQISSALTDFLESPAGPGQLALAANGARTVLAGAISMGSDVHLSGTSAPTGIGTGGPGAQLDAAAVAYSTKWCNSSNNNQLYLWSHSTSLLPGQDTALFQQITDINDHHFLDIGGDGFGHLQPSTWANLPDLNDDSTLALPPYSDSNGFDIISDARVVGYDRRAPNLASLRMSPFDDSLAPPSWPNPNMMSYNRAMESSYQHINAYDRCITPLGAVLDLSLANTPVLIVQRKIVEDLVDFAFSGFPESPWSITERQSQWRITAPKIEGAFLGPMSPQARSTGLHTLDYFVHLYFDNFAPLWPLIRIKDFDAHRLSPTLYLILTSTGAMYSNKGGMFYGSMMIDRILSKLLESKHFYDGTTESSDSLLIFMLLTQIATLYFGERRGIPRAHHLGNIIVSQARKAHLFIEPDHHMRQPQITLDSQFDQFMNLETKRRIAFGIFRADVFMSAVLNTRPFMSAEEIQLRLPCSDEIWLTADMAAWQKHGREHDCNNRMVYADLARISMDRSEPMPYLSLPEQDLVLFAAQESVWRFCHDPDVFDRIAAQKVKGIGPVLSPASRHTFCAEFLTAREERCLWQSQPMCSYEPKSVISNEGNDDRPDIHAEYQSHRLDCATRQMADLRLDYNRTIESLRKWKNSFLHSVATSQGQVSRYRLLNSRLLYHLSFLRLEADVGSLSRVASSVIDASSASSSSSKFSTSLSSDSATVSDSKYSSTTQKQQYVTAAIKRVHSWAHTPPAEQALQHALAIWSLISEESEWEENLMRRLQSQQRTQRRGAKFNILSLISLYHAAMVVWAYAGCRDALVSNSGTAIYPPRHLGGGSMHTRGAGVGASTIPQQQWGQQQHRHSDLLPIHRENSNVLLKGFVDLFRSITAGWSALSSFAEAVGVLAKVPCPIPDGLFAPSA